jgi:hypothetical protein
MIVIYSIKTLFNEIPIKLGSAQIPKIENVTLNLMLVVATFNVKG